ncbi:MAG TPA: hypothetical protein VG184_04565 [Acidimicrobiales bacterium]|nr:hypothetical protein [Acidimicrobiales bacterium]
MTTTRDPALEEERDFFLRSLRDLEAERAAGDMDEVDYQALKDDYISRAAEVLRRLEAPAEVPADSVPVAAGVAVGGAAVAGAAGGGAAGGGAAGGGAAGGGAAGARVAIPRARRRRGRPRWQAAAVIAAVVAGAGMAGWKIGQASSPRLAGGNLSGGGGSPAGASLSTAAVAQLLVDGQSTAAKSPVAALKDFNKILAVYPDQPQALTDEGWVLAQGGVVSQGEADLQRAERVAPGFDLPHAYLGIIMGDQEDFAGAVDQLRYYLSHGPDPALRGQATAALAAAQRDERAGAGG